MRRQAELAQERRQIREEEARRQAEEEEQKLLAKEERAAAERDFFYQYATIEEQWFARNQELIAAQRELQVAQKKGEDAVVAAYRKVIDAQRNFDSIDREVQSSLEAMGDIDGAVEDAVGSIDKKTGSSGTFSAYQAQEIAFGDYQRKLYDQSKTQTNLLRQLATLNREGSASSFV